MSDHPESAWGVDYAPDLFWGHFGVSLSLSVLGNVPVAVLVPEGHLEAV